MEDIGNLEYSYLVDMAAHIKMAIKQRLNALQLQLNVRYVPRARSIFFLTYTDSQLRLADLGLWQKSLTMRRGAFIAANSFSTFLRATREL